MDRGSHLGAAATEGGKEGVFSVSRTRKKMGVREKKRVLP